MINRRQLLRGLVAAGAGVGSFAVCAPPFFARETPREGDVPPWVERLAEARIRPWETGDLSEIESIRALNPEYDLMSRTFLALALADLAIVLPERWSARAIATIDAMIEDTDRRIAAEGQRAFLMSYGHGWTEPSLFVDGERLLVMTIRRLLACDALCSIRRMQDRSALAVRSRALGEDIAQRMSSTPCCSWPSYPDECWAFCNTLALAALRALTVLDGTPYHTLAERFVAAAKRSLRDSDTGLLVSAYTVAGHHREDPEGSSIWATTHFLRAVDVGFADAQYVRAREHFGRNWLGFGFGREWVSRGMTDVDSGMVVPLVGASPSSSGLAFLAARSAGDTRFYRSLHASLSLFGLPRDNDGLRSYRAGNAVGDTVILAGCTAGPLWERIGSFVSRPVASAAQGRQG